MKGNQISGLGKLVNAAGVAVDYGGNLPVETYTMDCSGGNQFKGVLTGNVVINVRNLKPGHEASLDLTQDGTGSRTVTFGAAAAATGQAAVTAATAPGITPVSTASATTIFVLRGDAADCTAARVASRQIV